jgi:hypothetical protein
MVGGGQQAYDMTILSVCSIQFQILNQLAYFRETLYELHITGDTLP